MEKIKEQFSKITKDTREKNKLSQEDMALKLYLSGKQTIYYYEKGKRIMKLPEFVELIQKFNETVVINKDGMSLVSDIFNTKKDNKENEQMIRENDNLVFLEKQGEVSFYEDKNEVQYQNVPGIGLIPVLDGKMEYQLIEEFNNIQIKYNLNGVDGYSIWLEDTCYEDNFWSLNDIREAIEEMFISSQKEKAISVMLNNVENKLEDEKIDTKELDFSNVQSFIDSLDEVLLDDGEFTSECFMDIAIPYALNYGELDSPDFTDAIWECIEEVFNKLKRESIKTVTCKYSTYSKDELKFDFSLNDDNSFNVVLSKNNKRLIFKEFYFGCSTPCLSIVLDAVKDDYRLFKSSPDLKRYIENRGLIEGDVELEYSVLKLDVKSMAEFFGKDYLENIINE